MNSNVLCDDVCVNCRKCVQNGAEIKVRTLTEKPKGKKVKSIQKSTCLLILRKHRSLIWLFWDKSMATERKAFEMKILLMPCANFTFIVQHLHSPITIPHRLMAGHSQN